MTFKNILINQANKRAYELKRGWKLSQTAVYQPTFEDIMAQLDSQIEKNKQFINSHK